MLGILVVDDEPRHRAGLANMLRRLRPAYKISEARNGADALRFVEANPVDIIITDIKMPIMDGLQFIENLGQKVKDIKIIILSAYGYFEYAQKAIALGAFDYLLKTLDESSVIDMLNRVEAEIKRKSEEIREKESLKKQLDSTFPVFLERQLNKWIKGNLAGSELNEIAAIFPYKGFGTVIVTRLGNTNGFCDSLTGDEANEVLLNIKYWIKEALEAIGHSISFFNQDEKRLMVTVLNTSRAFDLLSDENKARIKRFIENLKTDYGICAVVAFGRESQNIFDDIEIAYKEAITALEAGFFLETESILPYPDIKNSICRQVFIMPNEAVNLSNAIAKLCRDEAFGVIDGINRRILGAGLPEPDKYRDVLVHMLLNQVDAVQHIIFREKFYQLTEMITTGLKRCGSFTELNMKIKQVLSEIIGALDEHRSKKNDLVMEKCIDYIEKNYAEDLSLEKVAEMFFFNPSYFSTLFKSHTNINFSQYLLNVRLRNGRRLLEKTDCKVYEIAARIGYKDAKYFNRVFKKEFGMTPDEYRRM
jgi:two-component system response regulator YesN